MVFQDKKWASILLWECLLAKVVAVIAYGAQVSQLLINSHQWVEAPVGTGEVVYPISSSIVLVGIANAVLLIFIAVNWVRRWVLEKEKTRTNM